MTGTSDHVTPCSFGEALRDLPMGLPNGRAVRNSSYFNQVHYVLLPRIALSLQCVDDILN